MNRNEYSWNLIKWFIFMMIGVQMVHSVVYSSLSGKNIKPISFPPASSDGGGGNRNKGKKHNIILILTDDQDVELGSLNFMPETNHILRKGGAEFNHAYATTPMCCPSRSSLLTGLYVHNHNVYTNKDNCSNAEWRKSHERKSFGAYLAQAGYHTGYFGKYLNKYDGNHTPVGWNEWGGLILNSKYYNYSINFNGKRIKHGDDYHKDYYPDLIANDSINFLRQWKYLHWEKPVLLVMSFPSPHGPEDSAPQYSKMFFNVTSHHTPLYDFAPNLDKEWILRVTGKMLPIHKEFTDLLMTKRLQTLQSVDSAVRRMYNELKVLDELSDTYIIYTSDHGYHVGQFGLIKGKSFPFEFDVRVPFLVRGPGIEPGTVANELVLNIDLAPTILDIAGIEVPSEMDGRSVLRLMQKRKKSNRRYVANWPDTFLIESSGRRIINGPPIETEVSTDNDGEEDAPPNEPNLEDNPSSETVTLSRSIVEGKTENGFKKLIKDVSLSLEIRKADRLAMECRGQDYRWPCRVGQKWHCTFQDKRWRKHKCRSTHLKKCTCITEEGIVYQRFRTDEDEQRNRNNKRNIKKNKKNGAIMMNGVFRRNKTSDELIDELAKTWRTMKRHRRSNTLLFEDSTNLLLKSEVSTVIDVINEEMMQLQSYHNNTSNTTCIITFDGKVDCAHEIYDTPLLWQTAQRNIVKQINKLEIQLQKLKEIEKHLHERRMIEKEENIESEIGDSKLETNETRHETNNSTAHRHRHQHEIMPSSSPYQSTTRQYDTEEETKQVLANTYPIPDLCNCVPYSSFGNDGMERELIKEGSKKKMNNEDNTMMIVRKKDNNKKVKKRARLEKECYIEKMNCFYQDSEHWRTPPYWTREPFCFCMNANNNSYNCLRTVNSTHNFLYCEFVTGFNMFFNMRIDPYQQWNQFGGLTLEEKSWLKDVLGEMVKCKGVAECTVNSLKPFKGADSTRRKYFIENGKRKQDAVQRSI